MPGYFKKIGIVAFAALLLVGLSSCDYLEDVVDIEYSYLNISADNEYGIEEMEPGSGRYRFEDGAIVDIDITVAEGYKFLGWQGEDREDVVPDNGNYKIEVAGDKYIEAELELEEFLFLNLSFDNQDSINRDELENETQRIDTDINEITFKFNNDIGTPEDALYIYFENISAENGEEEDDEGLIDSRDISIEDNIITVEISDSFFEQNLGFGEKYLIKGDRADNSIRVSDIEGKSTRIASFEVATETVQPESPFLSIEKVNDSEIELFWTPSKDNKAGYGDTYVSKYNIYRSTDRDNFNNQVYDVKEVENPGEVSEIIYNDSNSDSDEIYYYQVTAELDENEYEVHWEDGNQESEPSNIVDTDF